MMEVKILTLNTVAHTAGAAVGGALALSVFGLGLQSTSLSSLLPQGLAGCSLHVSTEAVQLVSPAGGSAETELVLPNTTAFAGFVLHHQVVTAELSTQGAITAVTSTNALTLTIGTF